MANHGGINRSKFNLYVFGMQRCRPVLTDYHCTDSIGRKRVAQGDNSDATPGVICNCFACEAVDMLEKSDRIKKGTSAGLESPLRYASNSKFGQPGPTLAVAVTRFRPDLAWPPPAVFNVPPPIAAANKIVAADANKGRQTAMLAEQLQGERDTIAMKNLMQESAKMDGLSEPQRHALLAQNPAINYQPSSKQPLGQQDSMLRTLQEGDKEYLDPSKFKRDPRPGMFYSHLLVFTSQLTRAHPSSDLRCSDNEQSNTRTQMQNIMKKPSGERSSMTVDLSGNSHSDEARGLALKAAIHRQNVNNQSDDSGEVTFVDEVNLNDEETIIIDDSPPRLGKIKRKNACPDGAGGSNFLGAGGDNIGHCPGSTMLARGNKAAKGDPVARIGKPNLRDESFATQSIMEDRNISAQPGAADRTTGVAQR